MRVMLFTLAAMMSSAAQAGPLWQNTSAGMSLTDLKKAQPTLREAPKAGNGEFREKCHYTVGMTEIARMSFNTCFNVVNDRLVTVTLVNNGLSSDYQTIKTLLASKYGAPVADDACSGDRQIRECKTVFKGEGGTTITAGGLVIFGKPISSVTYEALPSGADKL